MSFEFVVLTGFNNAIPLRIKAVSANEEAVQFIGVTFKLYSKGCEDI